MARDIVLDAIVRKDSQGLRDLGNELDVTATKVDGLDTSLKDSAKSSEVLDSKIFDLKKSIKDLGEEYVRTGDKTVLGDLGKQRAALRQLERIRTEVEAIDKATTQVTFEVPIQETKTLNQELARTRALVDSLQARVGGDVSLLGDLKKEKANLRELENLAKSLAKDVTPDLTGAGNAAGQSFISGLSGTFDGLPDIIKPVLIAGVVEVAVQVAPLLGAALAGGISGATGTAAMAAGLFAASKNTAVQHAASQAGAEISKEFFGSGTAFVQPAIDAIAILEKDFQSLDVGDSLEKVAGTVTIVASGVGDFAKNVMPGLNRALDRMEPFAQVFAQDFAAMGTAVGNFADDVSSSKGALSGLDSVLRLVTGTIVLAGGAINGLADTYQSFTLVQAGLFEAASATAYAFGNEKLGKALFEASKLWYAIAEPANNAREATAHASTAVQTFGHSAEEAARQTGDLLTMWNALNGKQMTLDEAMLAASRAVDQVADAFEKGTKATQGHSKEVLENRVALEHAAEAAAVAASEYLKTGGTVEGAQKIMDEYRRAAEKATGATGADARAVHDLALQIFQLPPQTDVNITVTTTFKTFGHPPNYNPGSSSFASQEVFSGFGKRAGGGSVYAGGLYEVNELSTGRRVELFQPAMDGKVIPLGGQPSGGGDGSGASARAIAQAVASALMGMSVTLDGQRVGAIQGRHAALLERAG